jgi:uncharacterized protein
MPNLNEPLTAAERGQLEDFLLRVNEGKAMNLEEMDGFFCAAICGPEVVPANECLPHVWGAERITGSRLRSIEEVDGALKLVSRHWNTIVRAFLNGVDYRPVLLKDERGMVSGNDWAGGFVQGMVLRKKGWSKLMVDEEHRGLLQPVFALAYEKVPVADKPPDPIDPERRKEFLDRVSAFLPVVRRYFRGEQGSGPRPRGKNRPRNQKCRNAS